MSCRPSMGPRGFPKGSLSPCAWGCQGKTQNSFLTVLPYSSTCSAPPSVKRMAEAGSENPWIYRLWCVPPNPQGYRKSRGGRELQGKGREALLVSEGSGEGSWTGGYVQPAPLRVQQGQRRCLLQENLQIKADKPRNLTFIPSSAALIDIFQKS